MYVCVCGSGFSFLSQSTWNGSEGYIGSKFFFSLMWCDHESGETFSGSSRCHLLLCCGTMLCLCKWYLCVCVCMRPQIDRGQRGLCGATYTALLDLV